ncbi:hypothetical protein BH10PSE7_BH10PSE7_08570 [soil metagenome]
MGIFACLAWQSSRLYEFCERHLAPWGGDKIALVCRASFVVAIAALLLMTLPIGGNSPA